MNKGWDGSVGAWERGIVDHSLASFTDGPLIIEATGESEKRDGAKSDGEKDTQATLGHSNRLQEPSLDQQQT